MKTIKVGTEYYYLCPDGYEFRDENGNVIQARKIVLEKKKPKYPQTYEECLEVLGIEGSRLMFNNSGITQYERELYVKMHNLSKLLICRDVYWKLYGEEMGLGKPWEYDTLSSDFSPAIVYHFGGIQKTEVRQRNAILVFPTTEMRDAFYENFKDLIEECKELL